MTFKNKINHIIFAIHNRTFFKYVYYYLFFRKNKNLAKREEMKNKCFFNYRVNPESPNTFNEYLLWIKYHYRNKLWEECADKLKCKNFLIRNGFEKYVPKTLGIYKTSSEIILSELPDEFVLKTNNDSGSVYVCKKGLSNFQDIFMKLDKAVNRKYNDSNNEWVYNNIESFIFAEEMLHSNKFDGDMPDFKFFVFNGKYRFGFTSQNRIKDLRFGLFEDKFNYLPCEYIYLKPRKKEQLYTNIIDEMIKVAEQIGSLFDFVRVDMYDTDKGPMVGELTFITMSGQGAFTKKEYDMKFGEYFKDTIFYKLAHKNNE